MEPDKPHIDHHIEPVAESEGPMLRGNANLIARLMLS